MTHINRLVPKKKLFEIFEGFNLYETTSKVHIFLGLEDVLEEGCLQSGELSSLLWNLLV
jgi:hypothetical protein